MLNHINAVTHSEIEDNLECIYLALIISNGLFCWGDESWQIWKLLVKTAFNVLIKFKQALKIILHHYLTDWSNPETISVQIMTQKQQLVDVPPRQQSKKLFSKVSTIHHVSVFFCPVASIWIQKFLSVCPLSFLYRSLVVQEEQWAQTVNGRKSWDIYHWWWLQSHCGGNNEHSLATTHTHTHTPPLGTFTALLSLNLTESWPAGGLTLYVYGHVYILFSY